MRIASTPLAPIKPLNISEASDLAIAVKEISAAQTTSAVENITAVKNPQTVVDSVNDPSMTDLASSTNNSDEIMSLKSDNVYLPINVNIPANNTTPGTTPPLTEEEKRKRTILIASAVLLVLIVLVVIATRKK